MVGRLDALRRQLTVRARRDGRRRTGRPFATSPRRKAILGAVCAIVLAGAGCDARQADAEAAQRDAPPAVRAPVATPEGEPQAPGDSLRDQRRAAELHDFRATLGEPPTRLSGGASTASELVRRFASALERRDTAALRAMALSRAEFAYLYYDTHPISRPPYDLSPGLMWFQLEGNSAHGLRQLLAKRAGFRLAIVGHACDAPVPQGPRNRFHGGCVVRRQTPAGDVVEESLFGSILEREGIFKIVSYSNDL